MSHFVYDSPDASGNLLAPVNVISVDPSVILSERFQAEVTLEGINGETIDFDYNVGKMVHYEGDDGTLDLSFKLTDVALQLNLEIDANTVGEDDVPTIPYTQPSGTGAFDAEVEPWGNEENVDVPM